MTPSRKIVPITDAEDTFVLVPVEVHVGNQLYQNSVNNYGTVPKGANEFVQNATDKDVRATRVSLKFNEKDGSVTMKDNGCGVSAEMLQQRLSTVAQMHRKGEDASGEFGMGLLAPIGLCERFTITSCAAPAIDQYYEWSFNCAEVIATPRDLKIPRRKVNHTFESGEHPVTWRTMVRMEKVSKDPSVSHVDMKELINLILTSNGNKMRRYGTKVSIEIVRKDGRVEKVEDIHAPTFQGIALDEYSTWHPDCGNVVIRLYKSPQRAGRQIGPRGVKVGIIGRDYRLDFAPFARQIAPLGVEKKALEVLSSGVFEGEILVEKLEFHTDREKFKTNAALDGMAVVMTRWFKKVGEKEYKAAEAARRDTKNMERAELSLKAMQDLLVKYPKLLEAAKGLHLGRHPDAHTYAKGTPSSIPGGDGGGGGGGGRTHPDPDKVPRDKPDSAKPSVEFASGKGGTRRVVRGSTINLAIAHANLESESLWEFDLASCTITFNTGHPVWARTEDDSGDTGICRLQEYVILGLVTMLAEPVASQDAIRRFSEHTVPVVMTWLCSERELRSPKKAKQK